MAACKHETGRSRTSGSHDGVHVDPPQEVAKRIDHVLRGITTSCRSDVSMMLALAVAESALAKAGGLNDITLII